MVPDYYDLVIESPTRYSDVPVRIIMEELNNPRSNLLECMIEKQKNDPGLLMNLVLQAGFCVFGQDATGESDKIYKTIFITTESKRLYQNDIVRYYILYHELGHCCDSVTIEGKDFLEEVHRLAISKTPEAMAQIKRMQEMSRDASEFVADEFAVKYLGAGHVVKALRLLIKHLDSKRDLMQKEKIPLDTNETIAEMKRRIRNAFSKRHKIKKEEKLLVTLEQITSSRAK